MYCSKRYSSADKIYFFSGQSICFPWPKSSSKEDAGEKNNLINEHVKILESYSSRVIYASLRMELYLDHHGIVPIWSAIDEDIRIRYADLLERLAKKSRYDIDKYTNKWFALKLLLPVRQ